MNQENQIDKTMQVHLKQYQTDDFMRHQKMTLEGIRYHERYFFRKYLLPNVPTLEVGCGTGRICFGMEQELGFSNITAIDFVEQFIEDAKRVSIEKKSKIIFQTASVTDLPFENDSFHQIVCLGVILSHLPHRKQRIKALQECYRVLNCNGILLINTKNIYRKIWYLPLLRFITKITRLVINPYQYEDNALPRLGTGGKFDLLFLRQDKPQLYYYCPGELVFDVLTTNFHVIELVTSSQNLQETQIEEGFRSDGANIYVVAKKPLSNR